MARKNKTESKFDNRTRFNWAFHDAALAVQQGWDSIAKNFGFGPAMKLIDPRQVIDQHFDKTYARGWLAGLQAARAGTYNGSAENAFDVALADGLVEE